MNTILLLAAVYGTLTAQTNLVYAPPTVNIGNANYVTASITEPQANALGYKLVIDTPPACASNEYAVARGWEIVSNRIQRVYNKQIAPVAVPRYSIADLTFWCVQRGKMDAVSSALKEAGYYEVYLTTQEIAADNELFMPTMKAIAAKVGMTDEDIADALKYALIGGAE